MRDLPFHRVPPIKVQFLTELKRGPVTGKFNGPWVTCAGTIYNTHSILWAVKSGLATFDHKRTSAKITLEGTRALYGMGSQI